MTTHDQTPSPSQEAVISRFIAACQADSRVVAAFLGGSLARGTADAYSDLDLYLITTDAAYDDFFAGRTAFMRLLGEPQFLEDWRMDGVDLLFFIYPDGAEGELGLGRASNFAQIHSGPYRVLVDKQGLLAGVVFPPHTVAPDAQREELRSLLNWFWHDLSHFTTALGRGQLWAAYGAVEDLRRTCVNLARLRHDFAAPIAGYEKLDQALPIADLAPLTATFGPLEPGALLQAARLVVAFYQDLAPGLAQAHDVAYPAGLAPLFAARLDRLGQTSDRR